MDESEEPIPGPSNVEEQITGKETIESFALANNVSVSNVKDMIYHIITDPKTFASLVGSDKQALPHLRLTRSKWKEIQKAVETPLEINLNPVEAPLTFLDVDYGRNEDEDDDPDFIPDDDGEPDNSFRFLDDLFDNVDDNLFDFDDNLREPQFLSTVNNEYREFLNSLQNNNDNNVIFYDNDSDSDYEKNVFNFDSDDEDKEEFLMNRTTEVPRREIEDLWKDFDIDVTVYRNHNHLHVEKDNSRKRVSQIESIPDYSTCLLKERPWKFTMEQKKILEHQLAQHVQLLVQGIVGSHGNPNLQKHYNYGISLLNDFTKTFDDIDPNNGLERPNIHAALTLVNEMHAETPEFLNPPDYEVSSKKEGPIDALSRKHQWAISTCEAICYPHLFLVKKLEHFEVSYSTFLPSERMLLAIGLLIFNNVPFANSRNAVGRYQLISDYFLPNKNANQIRTHLKHCRQRNNDELSQKITAAAEGKWTIDAKILLEPPKIVRTRPVDWPLKLQPEWLKDISQYRHQFIDNGKKFSVFAIKENTLVFLNEIQDPTNVQIIKCAELPETYKVTAFLRQRNGMGKAKDPEVMVAADVEDSKDGFIDVETIAESFNDIEEVAPNSAAEENIRNSVDDEGSRQSGKTVEEDEEEEEDEEARLMPEPAKQTSKQRRYERLVNSLFDETNKAKNFKGLVAAIQADINRQFFMHEEKLKEFRKIISSPQKDLKKIAEDLKSFFGEDDHEILFLLSILFDGTYLGEEICDSPIYRAIKSAVDLLLKVQAYLHLSRGVKPARKLGTWFRNQQDNDLKSLQTILKSVFKRDHKLYSLLFNNDIGTKIPEDRYEVIDLSKTAKHKYSTPQYEMVEIPFKRPRLLSERSQPQLHQGSIIYEKQGCDDPFELELRTGNDTVISWSNDSDLDLLKFYLRCNDIKEAAKAFCDKAENNGISLQQAITRLEHLKSN